MKQLWCGPIPLWQQTANYPLSTPLLHIKQHPRCVVSWSGTWLILMWQISVSDICAAVHIICFKLWRLSAQTPVLWQYFLFHLDTTKHCHLLRTSQSLVSWWVRCQDEWIHTHLTREEFCPTLKELHPKQLSNLPVLWALASTSSPPTPLQASMLFLIVLWHSCIIV